MCLCSSLMTMSLPIWWHFILDRQYRTHLSFEYVGQSEANGNSEIAQIPGQVEKRNEKTSIEEAEKSSISPEMQDTQVQLQPSNSKDETGRELAGDNGNNWTEFWASMADVPSPKPKALEQPQRQEGLSSKRHKKESRSLLTPHSAPAKRKPLQIWLKFGLEGISNMWQKQLYVFVPKPDISPRPYDTKHNFFV